jgi:hypothetical protein
MSKKIRDARALIVAPAAPPEFHATSETSEEGFSPVEELPEFPELVLDSFFSSTSADSTKYRAKASTSLVRDRALLVCANELALPCDLDPHSTPVLFFHSATVHASFAASLNA